MGIPKVRLQQASVRRAITGLEPAAKVLDTSEKEPNKKIVLTTTENVSSVKRVKNRTRLEADVREQTRRKSAVQRPTAPWKARNGRFHVLASW